MVNSSTKNLPASTKSLTQFLLVALATVATPVVAEDQETGLDFSRDVRPIFAQHCVKCHGAEKQRGGFRIDSRESAFGEADSGDAPIVVGKPDESELMRRIVSDDDGLWMPPDGARLSPSEIETVKQWIAAGAQWPDSANAVPSTTEMTITGEDRQFWSFQPLKTLEVPKIDSDWVRTPIDAFVLRTMRQRELRPNEPARPLALQRRMHFDVLGLPPSEQQVISTESNELFDADLLADTLLENKHFGERWARHWLDVARYADSNGYENDLDRPNAYQYRDFVIRALNSDLPFDQFVRWQIAGDELQPDNPVAVAATGFLAAGPLNRSAATAPEEVLKGIRYDELDDIVSTTSQAFLGLTLGCARCHDHKFDAIPTRDYYRMVATFASSSRQDSALIRARRELDLWRKRSRRKLLLEKIGALDCTEDEAKWLAAGPGNPAESKRAFKKYGKSIEFDDQQWRAWLTGAEREHFEQLEAAANASTHESEWAKQPAVLVTETSNTPVEVRLLKRGDVGSPADVTPPGFFSVLTRNRSFADYHSTALARNHGVQTTGNRSAFALWLTDIDHGAGALTARVIVNRIWYHYFGTGLVATPNDFGVQGSRPSHPELLEWLAAELVRNEWKLKSIHRLILTSNVYRQSSQRSQFSKLDPAGRWLSYRKSKRLDSEATRDAILAVSGRLNRQLHGPAIRPFIPAAAMATRSRDKWPTDIIEGPEHWRRSLYIFVKRSIRFPMMEAFDAPDPTASCGRRVPTTVAVQALTLLNNPSIRGAARDFAAAVRSQDQDDVREQVGAVFRRSLGRPPTESELKRSVEFLSTSEGGAPLADLCHALLMSNEFVYIE